MTHYRRYARAKIHRATVTGCELEYEGSIAICPVLLEFSGIVPHQLVHINGLDSGVHWETYVIEAEEEGTIELNGPPANLFRVGEQVVIVAYEDVRVDQSRPRFHTIHVDESNEITGEEWK